MFIGFVMSDEAALGLIGEFIGRETFWEYTAVPPSRLLFLARVSGEANGQDLSNSGKGSLNGSLFDCLNGFMIGLSPSFISFCVSGIFWLAV